MILTYHEIVPSPSKYVYSATVAQFEEHLAAIDHLPDGIACPEITFDDGHASHHRHALPCLQKTNKKAIFFVTAGWSGVKHEYMDWAQLSELVACGHEVQSHGWSHAFLNQCGPSELTDELRRSRQTLEDRLAVAVDAISMPGGRYNANVLRACQNEGYKRVYTSELYLRPSRREGVTVSGRAMVRNNHDRAALIRLTRSEQDLLSPERIRFHVKRTVRSLVGDTFYHRVVWRMFGTPGEKAAINESYLAK